MPHKIPQIGARTVKTARSDPASTQWQGKKAGKRAVMGAEREESWLFLIYVKNPHFSPHGSSRPESGFSFSQQADSPHWGDFIRLAGWGILVGLILFCAAQQDTP
jgi:hypothetical protein